MSPAVLASVVLLGLYGTLGTIDAVYLHLWRYRLFAHPSTRGEHVVHTLRTLLFPPIVWLLYVHDSGGPLLWLGTALAALDLGTAVTDMFLEPASRAPLGGLSRGEYVLHGVLNALHSGSLALVLVARPAAAWAWGAPAEIANGPLHAVRGLTAQLLPGALVVAALHVVLLHPRFARAARPAPAAE